MSSFYCGKYGEILFDYPDEYIGGCKHYLLNMLPVVKNKEDYSRLDKYPVINEKKDEKVIE